MCGAYNIINHPFVDNLTEFFAVPKCQPRGWANCGSDVEIIIQQDGENQLRTALWWLLLQKKDGVLKPSQYTSFNSRYKSGGFSTSNKRPFKYSRCIIPARGFVEGMNKKYHYLEPVDQPIAFGGLYKRWHTDEGEALSCSIITIDPHPKFDNIHKKAMPLMLPVDEAEVLEAWLDPDVHDADQFLPYFQPNLRTDFTVTPLQKWRSFAASGESFIIPADTSSEMVDLNRGMNR